MAPTISRFGRTGVAAVFASAMLFSGILSGQTSGITSRAPSPDSLPMYIDPSNPHWRSELSCGVSCSYMLLRIHGREASYPDVMKLVPIGEAGSSLLDMARGCEKLGLRTEAVCLSPTELKQVALPMIAHVSQTNGEGHYVVILGMDDKNVQFLDPVAAPGPMEMTRAEFFRRWTGNALVPRKDLWLNDLTMQVGLGVGTAVVLVSLFVLLSWRTWGVAAKKSPSLALTVAAVLFACGLTGCDNGEAISSPSSCKHTRPPGITSITAWKQTEDVARVEFEKEVVAEFPIQNTTDAPVVLELGPPSCTCSAAQLEPRELAPGQQATLRLALSAKNRAGRVGAEVMVSARGTDWADRFRITGNAIGSKFPTGYAILSASAPSERVVIKGSVYSALPSDTLQVSAVVGKTTHGELIEIGQIEVTEAAPYESLSVRDVIVPVSMKKGGWDRIVTSETIPIDVQVTGRNWSRGHRLELMLIPNSPTAQQEK